MRWPTCLNKSYKTDITINNINKEAMNKMRLCMKKIKINLSPNLIWFTVCILLSQCLNNNKYSIQLPPTVGNSSSRLISLKHRLPSPTSGTSSTPGTKNTGTMREFGSGEKAGEAEQWPNKELEEQEELLMAIAIGYILQLSMPTSWKNILSPKSANCLWKEFFFNSNQLESPTFFPSPSPQLLLNKRYKLP